MKTAVGNLWLLKVMGPPTAKPLLSVLSFACSTCWNYWTQTDQPSYAQTFPFYFQIFETVSINIVHDLSAVSFQQKMVTNSTSNYRFNKSPNFSTFTYPYRTNKCTVLLLLISLLIISFMYRPNCHQQEANTDICGAN